MPIELELDTRGRSANTHEGFKVDVRIVNSGPDAVEAPNLFDTSHALTFELYTPAANRLRQMSGMTQQVMLAGVRPDPTPSLEELPPGDTWARTIDLAPYHYLLPAGVLRLRARYEYEPAQIRAFSELLRVVVSDPPLMSVASWREAGLVDSLLVTLRAGTGDDGAWFLRQYSFGSPLASWYSEPILAGQPAESVICSTATFTYAETFDPVFERWIVWLHNGAVRAQFHRNGAPAGEVWQAVLPAGWRLLPWSNHDLTGGPLVFFEAAPGRLECRRFEAEGLRPVFGSDFAGRIAAVRADAEFVHVLVERRGLVHERVTRAGERIVGVQLFRSRLPLYACEFEPFTGTVKALFRERPRGGVLEMFSTSFRTGESSHTRIEWLPLRDPLTELSFDVDRKGRVHLLAATSRGNLYYLGPNLGPVLVASGESRFFPRVIAQRGVYLGYYRSGLGFRFNQYIRHRGGPKILTYEEPV